MKQGWEVRKFEDCVDKVKITTKLPSSSYGKEGMYPIVSQEKELISGYWDNIEDVFFISRPVTIFGDHTMVVKYIDFNFAVGADGVKILQPKSFLNPRFFYYWVRSINIPSRGYARHYRYLKESSVVYPPLPEQQRIVEFLDTEFAKIDALKANAEKNLQHAKDLFQAALKEELQPKEGWVTKKFKINDVCLTSSNIKWKNVEEDKQFIYVDLTSVDRTSNSIIDPQIITAKTAPSRAQRIIQTDDIIFATTRPTLRRVCIVPSEYDEQICSTGFCVLKPNKGIVLPQYLLRMLMSNEFYEYIEPLQAGATYPAVTDKDVRSFEIPVPPLPEQADIVSRLDAISERCNTLQANYTKTITLCDDMKQALLRKAFSGEL